MFECWYFYFHAEVWFHKIIPPQILIIYHHHFDSSHEKNGLFLNAFNLNITNESNLSTGKQSITLLTLLVPEASFDLTVI